MTYDEHVAIVEAALQGSPNDWQRKVFRLIRNIPYGYLISYGHLAKCANEKYGLNISPRNVGWLRKKIYYTIGDQTDVPIHRIANQGDVESSKDHPNTQRVNREKRTVEGTYPNPRWVKEPLPLQTRDEAAT